jgi:hypothetical protein
MKSTLLRLILMMVVSASGTLLAYAQGSTGSITGAVLDPTGAVIAGATVTAKNVATGAESKTTSTSGGTFTIPSLGAGLYTMTIVANGFKQAVVQDVKVDVGTPASVNIALEVGAASESVVVQGGSDVLQTQSANVSTTITGRQITELPFASRDALDLVLLLPGTTTPGRPRTSTVNGLPKGSLNITMDGVNVQDNTLKSSDGFFTYIRPRIDAVDEVTLSTATPGAESAGEGAVQIKFVTRSGSNEFHGSVYEYHRNPFLNANYWFNNRDSVPINEVTKARCDTAATFTSDCRAPRDRVLLNQFGFRVGGPIIKDRALFFANYEEYRLPEQTTRQRTILSPDQQAGIFQYDTANGRRQVNILSLAQANGFQGVDPTISKLLGEIRSASASGGAINALSDPNYQQVTFTNVGGQKRYFPTVRFDINLSSKHRIENIWNYQKFDSVVDFLNNVDPAFPGFPNKGSQISNRFSNVIALRSTFTSRLVNEARYGITGGTLLFFPEVNAGQFTNQGGVALTLGAGISNGFVTRAPSRRNAPVRQFSDTVSFTKSAHSMNFGVNFTQVNYWGDSPVDGAVRGVTLGLATADPAQAIFTGGANGNFPGASDTQLNQARAFYALLSGRVTSISGGLALDENTEKYALNGSLVQRARQRELGFFAQDSWRATPNLTLTGGIRWEIQYPFTALNKNFSQTTYADLFGVSGEENLFKPGTLTGKATQFTQFTGDSKAYNVQYSAFAPSLGLAWTPDFKGGILGRILGEGGRTVLRGGYSIAYNREGMNVVLSILGSNPGGTLPASQTVASGTLPAAGILLRNGLPSPTGLVTQPTYPINATLQTSANAFLPDLKTGYVQSFTFGLQREIGRDTVFEVRYVGNRGVKLWRQYNMNEINVVENGFLNEFRLAQQNLAANNAAGGSRAGSFAYFGTGTGTVPLPTIAGFFNGLNATQASDAARYTSTFYRNTTFTNNLNPLNPSATGFANTIYSNPASFDANRIAAGIPANIFVVNPTVGTSGTFLVDNGGRTSFDSLVLELRRRLSKGLLVQGSYAWASAFTNMYVSSSTVSSNYTTLRNPGLNKVRSPFGITHAFKANWIYELPFGRSRQFLSGAGGAMDRLVGGWAFHGTTRIQSGSPVSFGAVNLVGMTRKDLQDAIEIRKDPNRIVFFLPDDIILNTRRAFNPGSALGTPSGRYFEPTNANNNVLAFGGQRGFSNLVVYGPRFTRFDLSVVKTTKITERVNFEFRAEFLNAFNNINFSLGNAANDTNAVGGFNTATFGQTTQAYRDLSTTNDPGGRLIQFVARINF